MNKVFFSFLFSFVVGVCLMPCFAQANHPFLKPRLITQSNGDTLTVIPAGNEHQRYFLTTDRIPLLKDKEGDYCYAYFDESHKIKNTFIKASSQTKRKRKERKIVKQCLKSLIPSTLPQVRTAPMQSKAVLKAIGSPTIPVIMVNFSDVSFLPANTLEVFNRQLNEVNYKDERNVGSVKDYFIDQSDSLFIPHFKLFGSYTLSQTQKYYGENNDMHSNDMATEAVNLATQAGVDFSEFVVDGKVPTVCIIYAGCGEQNTANSEHCLNAKFVDHAMNSKETYIRSYFCVNELLGAKDSQGNDVYLRDGIGVFCHEFGHVLGLPDFYDTRGVNFGMDIWSVMDIGMYWDWGFAPVGYGAYEKEYMGWLTIPTLTEKSYNVLKPLHKKEGTRAYKIVNSQDANEYYILDNRQPNKWRSSNISSGLFVTHVTYNPTAWAQNWVNVNPDLLRMTFIPANNLKTSFAPIMAQGGDYLPIRGNLFPGPTKNNCLADTTTPSAEVYTGETMQKPICEITMHKNGDISFYFLEVLTQLTGAKVVNEGLSDTYIYDLRGRLLKTFPSSEDKFLKDLPSGIYILRKGEEIKKIFIP